MASRLLSRLLTVLAAGSVPACGLTSSSSSVDSCDTEPSTQCFPRKEVWDLIPKQDGGTQPAEGCPTREMVERSAAPQSLRLKGYQVTEVTAVQDSCCITTAAPLCEGRPLYVDGVARTARVTRGGGWA